ncbi:MAG: gliding motility-associated C-terminal domain-containing protein [Burkholderiales bacterium]|nr:gliding motility-associated C-terminal domain-containing protein [Bacteroidia bacterium]
MKHLFTLFFSIFSISAVAQNYNMDNTSVTTCGGNFYDSGGSASNYGASETFTKTFCPSTVGDKLSFNFTAFQTESATYDYLTIYDGPNTSSPTLGTYATTVGPGIVQATSTNTSGCLTFVFKSDATVFYLGWAATITCITPCQTINAVFNSSSPAPGAGSIIRVCQGQSVTFNGSGTFSGGGGGAVYSWNFDNGLTGSGTSASTTYTAPGVYVVNLNITKAGCTNQNKINQIVQVSTTPSFSATTTSTTSICLGQSATLIGSVTPTPFQANCTPPVSGTTFLPDGSGLSYSTAITVDCYGSSQTITSAADINNICLNMEHSYQGDLSIQIICPNGQICNLKDYPGGAYNYLGAPLDDPAVGPGVGANYCFAMSGTVLLSNGPTIAGQGTPAYTSIAAGTYSPTGNFSSLIGCPLNGNWTIKVTDNLGSDNGYIFSWDVNFNAAVPASQSFTPTIVSQTWSGPNITSTAGNNAVITPTSTGTKCYTLTAVDNFGCSYISGGHCITVNPGPYAGVSNTLAVCNSAASSNLFGLLGAGVSTIGTWSGPAPALTGGNLGTFNPASYTAGTYNYTYTVPASGGCPAVTAVVSVTIRPNPAATLSFTNPSCGNSNGIIVINNTSSGGQTISSFASSLGSISGQTVTGLSAPSTPVITLTNNFGCTFTVSATLTMTPGPTNIAVTPTNATCGNNNGSITFNSPTGGTSPYTYAINGGAFTATSPTINLPVGTYSVTVKDFNGCVYTETTSITNIPGPTAIAGTTTQASCNTNNGTFNVTGVTGGTAIYTFSVNGVATTSLTSGLAAGTHTILVKDGNGCTFSTTFVIGTANGPSSFVVNTTNSNCGLANGTSTVSGVVGGTPTYSFSFDGGAFGTGTTASGLTATTHTVIVKDVNSCTITATYSVSNNPPPTASITSSANVLCNGGITGSLTAVPIGGTGPFTYTLTSPTQTNSTGAFTGLAAGTYSVTIKDIFSCTATVSAVISQPTILTGTTSSIPVNCFGNSTGTVSAGGAGGTGPYTYLWSLGSSTLATVGGAAAGTYTVTIRDANLCVITRTVTVTQPASLTLTSTLTPATCGNANGSGTVTVGGGTSTYNFNWSNGGLTNVLSAASAGTYSVTVTDFNGCMLTRTVALTNTPGPTAITGTTTLAGCNLTNGSHNVTGVTGGTAAYTYSVDGVATPSLTSGLAAGTHTILVRDFNGCTFSSTFNINTANGPTTATILTTNASCGSANGTATLTGVTGGVAPYQYSFDGSAFAAGTTTTGLAAGTHTVIISDVNSCTLAVTYTEFNNSGPTASVTSSLNVLCNGASTGSLTVAPSGGTAPFTYTLTAPTVTNTTGNFTGLPAGTYNMTVKDFSGCTATASVTLIQPTPVTLTVTSLPALCFGSSTGTVSASGSGGSGAYTYLWPALGSSANATVSNVAAGTYSVTQTDGNGCSITQSITVTQPTSLTLTSTLTPATCGNANGSGTVTVAGGTPAYTYNWSNSGITSVLGGVSAGTYTLVVTDFKGCVLTRTVNVTNIPGPTAITGTTTLAGCGLSNGSYNVTGVTGGTSAYSFSVDGIATTSLTSGLSAGTHSVAVSDFNGCIFITTFNINTATGPTTASIVSTNATCGSANGTATVVSVTGGSSPYQYSFEGSPFALGTNTIGLLAGTHTVTIKDANSCTLTTTYNVLNNGMPTVSVPTTTNTTCFGSSNGGFAASGSGGSGAPFTYTLTSPFQNNGTGIFTGLPAGTYNVITKDIAGCMASTSVTITQPSVVTLTPTSVPAKCFGAATGTINIAGAGGTGAYQYALNGGAYQASATYTAVGAGIYNISIKDANGCTATQTVQVAQPTALAITVSSQNANCIAANGIATTTITGGTPIYTYTWTGGGGAASTSNGVITGNYTVTATDANGCVISSPVVIGLTPGGTATITSLSNVTCNGAGNGSMTTGMIGGAAPFTYSWTPGGQTSATAVNLVPGTYTCQVTDFYGCKSTVAGIITQPPTLTAIMNSNNVKCYGTATGTVSAAGTGGTGPYTYLWPTIPSTLSTVSNVLIGNYNCNITDANGCTITQSISVTQPTSITLTSTVTTANCNQANGSATVIASGGAPGAYTYTWSSGSNAAAQSGLLAGTYTIQVQDANNCIEIVSATIPNMVGPVISIASQTNVSCFGGCNGVATTAVSGGVGTYTYSWSNGNVSSIAPNLCAQIYTVSVTDGAGCVSSTSVTITQPTPLTVGIVANNPKCFGAINGYGIAAALGGTPNYTYSWSGGGGNSATSSPLGAGGYNLLVTDGNGCTVTSTMTLNNPPAMAASITSTNVSCFGTCNGTAIATSTNGIGAVGYFWVGGSSPIASQTASSLCAGTYTMVATDQNSCTASAIITITQPPVLTANISSTGSVTCNGGNNGFAVVSAGGGTPTYSYTWSGAASTSGNSANANTLPAGVYAVTVIDTKGCSVTTNATIIEPAPFTATLTPTNAKCNGVCDGTANIAFSGGAGTTTFLWQPGLQSGNFVNNLCAGGQTVTITSNGSCPTILTFTLTEPALLTAVASATTSNCGQANGKTCVVVSGGTSPFASTLWSNGVNTLCNNNISAGAYNFAVTDANGCIANASGLVNDIAAPIVAVTSQTNVSCFGGSNGGAIATASGGVPSYTISWSGAQSSANTTLNPVNFGAGLHNITVVDAAGCIGTASVNITQPAQLVSAIGSFTNVTCNGLSNGGATILTNGGTTPYSYTWTPSAQTSSVLANVPANTYTAFVSDGMGCVTSSQVVISQPQALILASSGFSNISCFGGTNGQIFTTVQGGTPGYTYVWNPAQSGNSGVIGSLPAGGYSLTVTDSKTCSINANFTILEPSILTSTYTSLPAKCGLTNGSSTVTVGGGTPSYTLNWNTAPAQQGSIASNMAPGSNWQCVITDLNGCSITQTVNVNNAPSPIFSSPVVTKPSCFGMSNGDITVNYTSGTGPYTVIWSSPISQTTTASVLTQSIAGIAQGAYTATLTDVNGCATSQLISVTQPGKLILMVSPDVTICYGQSTQLSVSGQSGSPAYTYTWTPNSFTGGGPHTVNPTTMTSYNVMVGDTKGCTDGPKVITINVTPLLSIAGRSVTICDGGSAIFTPTITSPGNGGAYSYTWSPAAGNVNSIMPTGQALTAATTVTYALIVSDGCTLPYASTVFTLVTNPLPTVTFTASTVEACAPANIDFMATPGSSGNYSYSWISDNKDQMGTTNPLTYNYALADTFSVKLVIMDLATGCSNTEIKNNYILINKPPVASFYADPPKASILDPNINFVNTSQGATSYFWDFGDPVALNGSNNSTVVNPSHGYSNTGEYAVNLVATSIKGCKDIARILVEITPDFALYIPNAFTPDDNGKNDVFLPMGVGIDEENFRMDIFDRWGENIYHTNEFRKGWNGMVKGGSKLAPQGVYVYKLQVTDTQGGKHPFVGHVTVIRKSE